ncbi:hypothetical protein CDEF62S_00246 [Castellaniella defragrans]
MSILINKDTKVITQGITGKTGQYHTHACREYATGVRPLSQASPRIRAAQGILSAPRPRAHS